MAITPSHYEPMNLLKKLFSRPAVQTIRHNPRFDEVREDEEAFTSIDRGTSLVPLDLIVGSVGRYHDFDAKFSPKSYRSDERLRSLTTAMSKGRPIPPISLYQIKDSYYILDGHHRFTVAKNLGHDHIRACILELLPSKDTLENKLYLEKIGFRDRFKLPNVPELTEPGQYHYLNEQIEEHCEHLSTESGAAINPIQAAADWYQTIYLPLKRLIDNSGLIRSFKDRTVDDLYLYISLHQWKFGKSRQYGIGIDKLIPKNMEEFRQKMKTHTEQEYPEMKREIIAFVLMNVEGRHEEKIMSRLEALEEVREAHSVHGSIDIIIRVRLIRDLLSSDAELLSQFLTSTIRQWPGVISTQTLLPGISRIKDRD